MFKPRELLLVSESSDEIHTEFLQTHILQDFIYLSQRALRCLSINLLVHPDLCLASSTTNQH